MTSYNNSDKAGWFPPLLPLQVRYIPGTYFNERWKTFVSGSKVFIFPPKILPSQPKDIITLYLGLLPLPSSVDNSKRYFNLTYSATRGDEYLTERQESHFIVLLRGRKTKNLLYTHPAVAAEADTEYAIALRTLRQHF